MIKERYRDNVGYLHSQKENTTDSKIPQYEEQGVPFRYNTINKRGSIFNAQTGTYQSVSSAVWVTDSQLKFKQGDRVTDKSLPLNNANYQDFGLIESVITTDINPKYNKYRTIPLVSSEITIQ